MTGVVPGSGGSMVLSGFRPLGGRITPSHRPRPSLRVVPGHIEPVDPGFCGWDLFEGLSSGLGGADV
jgi:hypothetical protein